MSAASDRRGEHEQAALAALRSAHSSGWARGFALEGFSAGQLYGWAPQPHPDGWSERSAERAARRLEARGELTSVRGDHRYSRRWKLPTEVSE